MSAGRLLTTPWSRAELNRLGVDRAAIAARIPNDCSIHLSERNPRGPWFVRAFIEGREITDFDRYAPGTADLEHTIEYVLKMLEGARSGS